MSGEYLNKRSPAYFKPVSNWTPFEAPDGYEIFVVSTTSAFLLGEVGEPLTGRRVCSVFYDVTGKLWQFTLSDTDEVVTCSADRVWFFARRNEKITPYSEI